MTKKEKEPSMSARLEEVLLGGKEWVNGYFLVYEGIDKDGERALHYVYPDEQAYWNSLGMLYAAIDIIPLLGNDELEEES